MSQTKIQEISQVKALPAGMNLFGDEPEYFEALVAKYTAAGDDIYEAKSKARAAIRAYRAKPHKQLTLSRPYRGPRRKFPPREFANISG
jgi:hypothetical protein